MRPLYKATQYVWDEIDKRTETAHRESRFGKMYYALCNLDGSARPIVDQNDSNFEIAREAIRDVRQLEFVFDQLTTIPTFLMSKLIKDSDLPQKDRQNSPGRDTQLELFIAAICNKAKFLPITHEEPDLAVEFRTKKYGIAIKRLKSVGKLERHIRKAISQINNLSLPGFIVMDTCLAFNEDNLSITESMSLERFIKLHRLYLDGFVRRHHNSIQDWIKGKWVRGIIFHDHQIRFDPKTGWELNSMMYTVNTATQYARRSREFRNFVNQYEQGLPTDKDGRSK